MVIGKRKEVDMLDHGSITLSIFNYTLLTVIGLLIVFPLAYVLSNSFSSYEVVNQGQVLFFPKNFTLDNFIMVFKEESILRGYFNTIIYTVLGTIISMILTFTAGFVLSIRKFSAGSVLIKIFTLTMFVNGGMIPTYMVVDSLGLTETMWGFILPGCMSVWNVILVRTYIRSSIPEEMMEAAQIDGCSDFNVFVKIILPLCKPIIAIMVLFYAVGYWNSYYNAVMYLNNSEELYPLQMILNNLLVKNDFSGMVGGGVEEIGLYSNVLKYAVIVVSTAPILCFFPFVQKFFTKGLMAGSIKG
ncbi:MAG: carbohydrate ABC transporter permease [Clostridia bacterium]